METGIDSSTIARSAMKSIRSPRSSLTRWNATTFPEIVLTIQLGKILPNYISLDALNRAYRGIARESQPGEDRAFFRVEKSSRGTIKLAR